MKQLDIALLGLGTVGTGVINILEQYEAQLESTLGVKLNIKWIYVNNLQKERAIDVSNYTLTNNIDEILADDLDIVIEVMGNIEPTYHYLKAFLNGGTHVITANKDLLAVHLEELEHLAASKGVSLKYEASVAGGIPIVNAINNGLSANGIRHFMGIFNGTSNFILSKMFNDNLSYDDALQLATDLGFAEADPTADVDGIDAQRKVVITSYLAFNQYIKLEDVDTEGIRNVTLTDMALANALGYRIKLIGEASYDGKQVTASVQPTCLPNEHQLAHVENEYNAIYVDGSATGDTMYYGKGAGSLATGSAVVSDLLYIISHFDTALHTLPPHFEMDSESSVQGNKRLIIASADAVLPEHITVEQIEDKAAAVIDMEEAEYEQLREALGNQFIKEYKVEGV